MKIEKLLYFGLPGLILLASIPLYFSDQLTLAVIAMFLSGLSAIQTWKLVQGNEAPENKNNGEHTFSCQNQIFSSVDQLSAGIAHEINNPLGIIAQEVQWLRHILKSDKVAGSVDPKELEDCEDSLKEISRQVDRCNEIVQKLLSLARQVEPVIQEVEANDIVLSVLDIVSRETKGANIIVDAQLDDDLPPISTDPPLMRQAVLNLLVNARQAVEKDGSICVFTRKSGADFVEIEIRDSGCGIAPENLGRVFTPFFSTKPEGKGTGLGLAICRGIIERLGGEISVSSDLGKFTAFTIKLPVGRKANRSLSL